MATITKTKFNIIVMFFLGAISNNFAQNVNMFSGTVSRCGNNFYDSGGNGSNYSSNENYTLTIQPTGACSNVRLTFSSFDIENNREFMTIYDGSTTADPTIGTYTGATSPGTVTATNGALTIRFTSNAVFNRTGWIAAITCVVQPPMTYSNHTSTDLALGGTALLCEKDVQMMKIEVNITGTCAPALEMTNLVIDLTGTAPLASIDKVRIYYTGNSNVFDKTVEFGTIGGMAPAPTVNVIGSQFLNTGRNYFWIALDLSGTGSAGQTISTRLPAANSIIVGGTSYSPVARPTCTKTYTICNVFAGMGIQAWYRPENMTVTAGKVSSWTNDPLASAGAFTISQGTAANRPNHIQGNVNYKRFNYHDRADFVSASLTYLYNASAAPDLMGSNGSAFLIFDQQNIDGTGFTYSSNLSTNRYQLKPSWRFQTGNGSRGTTYDWSGVAPADAPREAGYLLSSLGVNSNMKIRNNSILDDTPNNLNNATYNPAITTGLYFGKNPSGGEEVNNDLSEVILLNTIPTAIQTDAIESYLSIKYGLTRGNNSGTSTKYNYIASNLSTVWDKAINTGYNSDIAGIGRDDNSTLNQKQSISVNNNEPVTIGLTSIAAENDLNLATFTTDKSFLMWGNNGMTNQTNYGNSDCFSNLPTGIQARIEKIWKVQNTNFNQQVTVGFETSMLVAYTPLSNLRLIVNNDPSDWSASTVYSGAVLNGSRIEFSGITLNNTYFTLATIDYTATPLPVLLSSFEVVKNKTSKPSVDIIWTTESENNSDYFEVEHSTNGIEWASISKVNASGNSSSKLTYTTRDNKASYGVNYYRLRQVDLDGKSYFSNIKSVNFEEVQLKLYPIPANNELYISITEISSYEIALLNYLGKNVNFTKELLDENTILIKTDELNSGMYYILITNEKDTIYKPFMKN